MSGIGGIYFLNQQPLENQKLSDFSNTLAHRGGDGDGMWLDGSIGLCHRMLHSTPESLIEKLPSVGRDGNLAISADARIDNREELIPYLGLEKYPTEKVTDSQIILAAYERWGEECASKLIGDFAFAIWDKRANSLFCARDFMGVKPFFYYASSEIFVFASELKSIISLVEVPLVVNELAVACYLENIFHDQAITFYKDIFRLPPASYIKISPSGTTIKSYWSFDSSKDIKLKSDDEYAEAFREIFTEAVRCRLRSAFPIGSSLSGGLDSSSVTCVARQLLLQEGRRNLHTFSGIFPSLPAPYLKQLDERKYINAVVDLGNLESHYIRADEISPLIDLEQRIWHKDEPTIGINMYIHWAMYASAQQQGVRVFLDGLDGDTTVSHGLEYLRELAISLKWIRLLEEARGLARKYGQGTKKIIWEHGFQPLVPHWVWIGKNLLEGRSPSEILTLDLANPSLAKRVGLKEYVREAIQPDLKNIYQARKIHCRAMNSLLMTYALELADSCASAFALETRYPFFDRRLMEFCLAIPPEQKLRDGMTRFVLHQAMKGVLPSVVQSRYSKANLSANFQANLLKYDKPMLENLVSSDIENIQSYVNVSALKEIYSSYSLNPMESNRESIEIMKCATLNAWIEKLKKSQK